MKRLTSPPALSLIGWIVLAISPIPALANVPVRDGAILERKAEVSGHKAELKTILLDQKKKREGIKCAVTKGGRGNVQNPESVGNPATGATAVGRYAPGIPTTPQTGATGGTLSEQQLASETGKVISGVEATQGTIATADSIYRSRSGEAGQARTVMEAFDQNSAVRIQNGLSWNQVMASANLLVQALNALNLANQSDASQTSSTLTGLTPPRPPNEPGRSCPRGFLGQGSAADPCRPAQCSTTQSGTPSDPACITRRYTDSDGNIRVYLELASRLILDTPVAASRTPIAQPITETELMEALGVLEARAKGRNGESPK